MKQMKTWMKNFICFIFRSGDERRLFGSAFAHGVAAGCGLLNGDDNDESEHGEKRDPKPAAV